MEGMGERNKEPPVRRVFKFTENRRRRVAQNGRPSRLPEIGEPPGLSVQVKIPRPQHGGDKGEQRAGSFVSGSFVKGRIQLSLPILVYCRLWKRLRKRVSAPVSKRTRITGPSSSSCMATTAPYP